MSFIFFFHEEHKLIDYGVTHVNIINNPIFCLITLCNHVEHSAVRIGNNARWKNARLIDTPLRFEILKLIYLGGAEQYGRHEKTCWSLIARAIIPPPHLRFNDKIHHAARLIIENTS